MTVGTGARITSRATFSICAFLAAGALRVAGTGFGAINARLVALAIGVASLQWQRATRQRIAEETDRATALHSVIDDGAFSALATLAVVAARIDALVVDTRLPSIATQVVATADLTQTVLANLPGSAGRVTVAYGFAGTTNTFLVGQTILVAVACRLAHQTIAHVIRRAFVGYGARRRWIFAADIRVADQILGANACSRMILHQTIGIRAARGRIQAWIDATLIYAGQIARTVGIGPTAG